MRASLTSRSTAWVTSLNRSRCVSTSSPGSTCWIGTNPRFGCTGVPAGQQVTTARGLGVEDAGPQVVAAEVVEGLVREVGRGADRCGGICVHLAHLFPRGSDTPVK